MPGEIPPNSTTPPGSHAVRLRFCHVAYHLLLARVHKVSTQRQKFSQGSICSRPSSGRTSTEALAPPLSRLLSQPQQRGALHRERRERGAHECDEDPGAFYGP